MKLVTTNFNSVKATKLPVPDTNEYIITK